MSDTLAGQVKSAANTNEFQRTSHTTRLILAVLLVLAGLAAALVTGLARGAGENGLAGAAAVLSLLLAGLLMIFIVPPLARSVRNEIAGLDFPFEPTGGGGVFVVIIIVVGFAAWGTSKKTLFFVFFFSREKEIWCVV